MDVFSGKRDANVNDGETASTVSQSKMSNKIEKAQQLAQDAQSRFGGKEKKSRDNKAVSFAQEPASPTAARHEMRDHGSDGKDDIRAIDKILSGHLDDDFDEIPGVQSLEQLSKSKSRMDRDLEADQEELEEQKQLDQQAQDIKQHFIDIKSGKQYDPDKRFGVIEDGTQLVYDNITTAYELNLPPDYYLKYI